MYEDDPFKLQQAEDTLRRFLELLHSQWISRAGDVSGLPYGDRFTLRVRLNKAELSDADKAYLVAAGSAITPENVGLTKLRATLISVTETGFTASLVDQLFEQLPSPATRPLEWYTQQDNIQLFQVLYLIMLRSGFWTVKHDHHGPIDTVRLGVDPLQVPEQVQLNFRNRRAGLKGIEDLTDSINFLHWDILQVLPRLLDENVDSFLRAYELWLAELFDDTVDEDGYEI